MAGTTFGVEVDNLSAETMFETRPNPLVFCLWLPRSLPVLLLPIGLCGILFLLLKTPSLFHDSSNLLLVAVILPSVIIAITILIGLPGAFLLATRKRVRVTPSGIEILVLPLVGKIRDKRSYFFTDIDSIQVGKSWFDTANIKIKCRPASWSRGSESLNIIYYNSSFFRLYLLDDLQQNIVYGIRDYQKFLNTVENQGNNNI